MIQSRWLVASIAIAAAITSVPIETVAAAGGTGVTVGCSDATACAAAGGSGAAPSPPTASIGAASVPGVGSVGTGSGGGGGGGVSISMPPISAGAVRLSPGGRFQSYVQMPTCGWIVGSSPSFSTPSYGTASGSWSNSSYPFTYTGSFSYSVTATAVQDTWDWGDGTTDTYSEDGRPPTATNHPARATDGSWSYPPGDLCNIHHTYKRISGLPPWPGSGTPQWYTVKVTRQVQITVSLSCGACSVGPQGGGATPSAKPASVVVAQIEGVPYIPLNAVISSGNPDPFTVCNNAYPNSPDQDYAFFMCMYLKDSANNPAPNQADYPLDLADAPYNGGPIPTG